MFYKTFLFLRSLLFTCIMVIITPPWTTLAFLATPFIPYRKKYYLITRWNVFIIWLAKVLCGIRYEIKGAENLPPSAAILLCKHQSAWETIFLLAKMPLPIVYVLKKELMRIPFFGWGLAQLRMIPIDRSQGVRAFRHVVTEGKNRLSDNLWIAMFPEGTRTAIGEQGEYKGGGTRLALSADVPIVPIALNSGECWPRNSFIKRPGLVTVSIGKPITPQGHTHEELMQMVENWIESEMRVISPHAYAK
ncbi:MAG: 1-acyl-sn-glycerol-3-phosphate acyltransferase [Oxalobacter sp.]|nr:MAG: 1-acyl-sn-glycerol-3-phosphate acyltransferase [Oxalobacter sp.]